MTDSNWESQRMFDDSEWKILVTRVLSLTREGRFPWAKNDLDLPVALVNDVEYATGSVDRDGRPPYFFQLWDEKKGELIARLESEPIPADSVPWETDVLSAAQLLPELFELAARAASGAPAVFSRLVSDLDSLDDPFS